MAAPSRSDLAGSHALSRRTPRHQQPAPSPAPASRPRPSRRPDPTPTTRPTPTPHSQPSHAHDPADAHATLTAHHAHDPADAHATPTAQPRPRPGRRPRHNRCPRRAETHAGRTPTPTTVAPAQPRLQRVCPRSRDAASGCQADAAPTYDLKAPGPGAPGCTGLHRATGPLLAAGGRRGASGGTHGTARATRQHGGAAPSRTGPQPARWLGALRRGILTCAIRRRGACPC